MNISDEEIEKPNSYYNQTDMYNLYNIIISDKTVMKKVQT